MNTDLVPRRPSNAVRMAAVGLCCLAGALPIASNGPFDAPGIATAAEKDEAPTKESESGDRAKQDPAQSEASKEAAKNGGDDPPGDEPESDADESEEVFVPSEDISEDIDVPFPVDI